LSAVWTKEEPKKKKEPERRRRQPLVEDSQTKLGLRGEEREKREEDQGTTYSSWV
jgi:hypothetical protein